MTYCHNCRSTHLADAESGRVGLESVDHQTDHGTLTAPDAPALGEVTLADLERYLGPLTPEAEAWGQDEALDLGGF